MQFGKIMEVCVVIFWIITNTTIESGVLSLRFKLFFFFDSEAECWLLKLRNQNVNNNSNKLKWLTNLVDFVVVNGSLARLLPPPLRNACINQRNQMQLRCVASILHNLDLISVKHRGLWGDGAAVDATAYLIMIVCVLIINRKHSMQSLHYMVPNY